MSAVEPSPQTFTVAIDRGLARGLLLALGGGALLAFSGAFGMGDMPLWFRLVYWEPMMLIGALWGHLASGLVEKHIDLDRQPWLMAGVLTAVISGPIAITVWAATTVIFDDDHALDIGRLPDFLLPVVVVTGVLSLLNVFLSRTPVQTHAAPSAAPRPASSTACRPSCAARRSGRWSPRTTICASIPTAART
jgi:hypothetical protein